MTLVDYLKPEIYNRGLEQGVQQGVQQGLEQGKVESKTEIARNMLAKGLDVDLIVSVTGLSSQEVSNIV